MSIRKDIRIIMVQCDVTLTKLVDLMNQKYNRKDSIQNLGKKINKGTLKYREAEEIAETLGYEIQWVKKSKDN